MTASIAAWLLPLTGGDRERDQMCSATPPSDLARLTDVAETLTIEIRPARSWVRKLHIWFFGIWLTGWFLAYPFSVGRAIERGYASLETGSWFLLSWLVALTLFALPAGLSLLWLVWGRERIVVDRNGLRIERRIPLHRRVWRYSGGQVAGLRARPTPAQSLMGDNMLQRHYLSGNSTGPVAFDYGGETIGFGLDLDEAEARRVVAAIRERLTRHA